MAAMGIAAACSNETFAGFSTTLRLSRTRTYSENAPSRAAEHFVAGFELRDALADRLHDSGEVHAQLRIGRARRFPSPSCA